MKDKMKFSRHFFITLMLFVIAAGCAEDDDGSEDTDSKKDSGAETDSGVDTDGGSDTDTDTDTDSDDDGPSFTRYTVDTSALGPSFITVADIDGNGKQELLVSYYGSSEEMMPPGLLKIFSFTDSLDNWSLMADVITEADDVHYPNHTTVVDVDGDTDMDIILPTGFFRCALDEQPCGNLMWIEQTDDGWTRHDLVMDSDRFYHVGVLIDFDDDGINDIVTVGEEYRAALPQWFKGKDDGDLFETDPLVMGEGLGSFPSVLDIDGDGDLDVASAEFFYPEAASFAWFERTEDPGQGNPAGTFERHIIDDQDGVSFLLTFIDDLYGDGEMRAIGVNHCNTVESEVPAGLFIFDIPSGDAVKSTWPRTELMSDFETDEVPYHYAPGHFDTGDIDGDGDLDIFLSGHDDPRIIWFEQKDDHSFSRHIIEDNLSHCGGINVADLDGDGVNELVLAAYHDNALYVYVRD